MGGVVILVRVGCVAVFVRVAESVAILVRVGEGCSRFGKGGVCSCFGKGKWGV